MTAGQPSPEQPIEIGFLTDFTGGNRGTRPERMAIRVHDSMKGIGGKVLMALRESGEISGDWVVNNWLQLRRDLETGEEVPQTIIVSNILVERNNLAFEQMRQVGGQVAAVLEWDPDVCLELIGEEAERAGLGQHVA